MTSNAWTAALPKPIAYVFSGGATLGAFQVGMLRALSDTGVEPDLVVGSSVGALNGAVVAESGDTGLAAHRLEPIWHALRTEDVFPGALLHQAVRLLRRRSAHFIGGLRRLVSRSLTRERFQDLRIPLAVLATNALTAHSTVFTNGSLAPALLASAAIPGVLPSVAIDGVPYWDGGLTSNVPLRTAIDLGAQSLVVLDVGDVCHRTMLPGAIAETVTAALQTTIRQQVLIEAPGIAQQIPILYLPRPCVHDHDLLDFGRTEEFIAGAERECRRFLAEAAPPVAGRMTGAPHIHDGPSLEVVLEGR